MMKYVTYHRIKYIIPLLLFAVLAIFFFRGLAIDPKLIPSSLIGRPAPQFTLPTLDKSNSLFSSRQLQGKPYLLNIWASGCESCQAEHATLLKIAKSKKIPVYGLLYKDSAITAYQFLQQMGNPYQKVFLDQDGRVALNFGVYGTPETFLIDAQGIVRQRWVGPLEPAKISLFRERSWN